MSFLNSILNEISGAAAPSATPQAPRPRPRDDRPAVKREPTAKDESSVKKEVAIPKETPITNGKFSNGSLAKRKADDELNDARHKLAKMEGPSGDTRRPKSASSTPPATAQPYRGTAGLDRMKMTAKPAVKPLPHGGLQAAASSSPAARPLQKSATSSGPQAASTTQTAPKKGSYAEMMARAAAAQKNVYVGIKHKPTEKQKIPTKSAKAVAEQKGKLDPREREKKHRLGSTEVQSGGETDKNAEKKRKHIELAYKGTMRASPKATAYKGTMGMKRPDADRNRLEERRRSLAGAESNRRSSYYDEYEDEEEEEAEQDYDEESDLSDMEANVFDVDEEERNAAKIAKDEDRREQELEARLKREKQAKLKKLQQDAIARKERHRLNGI